MMFYSPNTDTPQFYENIQMHIDDMQCQNVFWCGDFNLVLDPTIDCYNYKGINNPKARNKVLEKIETYAYIYAHRDPFRQLHEDLRGYTLLSKADKIFFLYLNHCCLV